MNWELLGDFNWELLGNFFAALVGILNPVGKIAVWSELAGDLPPPVRFRLALWNCLIAAGLLLLFLWQGQSILSFFGIQLPAFKVGGGALLFITAVSLFEGKVKENFHLPQEGKSGPNPPSMPQSPVQSGLAWITSFFRGHRVPAEKEKSRSSSELEVQRLLPHTIVPMAVPLLAGPGTLTIAILFGLRAEGRGEFLQLSGVLLLSLFFVLGLLSVGPWLERRVGKPLLSALMRIFALLLAGIAAQLILEGLEPVISGVAL
ncbi:Multiple antibiotic resistance (MarC)-related protein [Nitrosococcus oceani ATCC 19707]|uniref:UPF0056 inner membrane protein n=2 Tax=Nitrosococcus oceani TaxID=1229 RepID=Q3JBV2_NITOC|nr:MarC family protein [Nitrosococcus oceani]ABA57694.1 Multiple antibiotic resistance (MarC)-related protein [Nitrosococcus oceani ATCC 19707]EDZ68020.1 MarC family integral membrane protein [Nitrosococcus oceani AFC27]KFI19863.1 antibiotic resistance protein MarC [Nitrosococcus oceani C-27]GEM19344.1 antibiotic resistance protein MarC [Nitrosococcus oceani]